MAGRDCGGDCGPGRANEDNARFLLLGALLALYLLGGAAVFSALERPHERQARQRWEERLAGFGRRHNLSRDALRGFLRHFEEAAAAGVRVDGARPRWDFPGAFYFVGTVVSTIGELRARRATFLSASFTCRPFHCSGARAASFGSLFPSNARAPTFIAPSPLRQSLSCCLVFFFTGFRRGRWPERPITGAYPAVTDCPAERPNGENPHLGTGQTGARLRSSTCQLRDLTSCASVFASEKDRGEYV